MTSLCLSRAPRTYSSRNSLSRGARLRMRRQSYECNGTYSTTLLWKVDPRVRSQKGVGRGTAGGRDCGVKSELWEWLAGKSQASTWDCEGYDDICHDVCAHAWAQVDRVLRITRRPALPLFRAWFPVRWPTPPCVWPMRAGLQSPPRE